MTINRFELAPAAHNPPYPGGPYVGCCAAVAQDFIENYTPDRIGDLGALFASMTKRHRTMDPSCTHGIKPHGACAWCIYLELYARGLPVAYQSLTWSQIVGHMDAGHYVAIAGLYSQFPTVTIGSYGPTIPAHGRSDTYTGAHMVAGIGRENAGIQSVVLDPDFGNYRGIPPYSVIPTDSLRAYWQDLGSYAVCYATKSPGSPASPTYTATVTSVTSLWNPVTKQWRYRLKVGTKLQVRGAARLMGGKVCHPINGPAPYSGYWVPIAAVKLT